MKKPLLLTAFILPSFIAPHTLADEKSGFAIGGHGGTGGLGGQLTYGFNNYFAVRGGLQRYSYDLDEEYEDIQYKGDVDLDSLSLIADWYVFGGGFHLSAGIFSNDNGASAVANPGTDGSYEIDGVEYQASDVGTLAMGAGFDNTAPYVGLGWGAPANSNNTLTVTFDMGVLYQGSPSISLTRTGGTDDPALAAQIDAALENERQAIEDDASDLEYWPIIQLGLHYQF